MKKEIMETVLELGRLYRFLKRRLSRKKMLLMVYLLAGIVFVPCTIGFIGSARALDMETETVENDLYVGSIPKAELFVLEYKEKPVLSGSEELDRYIRNTALSYGLDWELVHAVIFSESRYNPKVTSSAGCQGLMQVSPKWHKGRMEKLGVSDLYDPYGNVLVGCDYLAELLSEYELDFALMVYNEGLTNAEKSYQKKGQSKYSQKIIQNYESLLNGGEMTE